MSLRKEVQEIITECRYEWKKDIIDKDKDRRKSVDVYTDDIISIFENRIDEFLKHYDDVPLNKYRTLLETITDPHPFLNGKIAMLKEVKEMLK